MPVLGNKTPHSEAVRVARKYIRFLLLSLILYCNLLWLINLRADFSSVDPGGYYLLGVTRVCDHPNDTYDYTTWVHTVLLEFSNYYPAPAVATFPDVAPGFWAFQQIEALAAAGITTGFPDGTYRPFDPVTRAQMAAFLARALGMEWP